MKYAVSIPTLGKAREPVLHETIKAFLGQTSPPDMILVIDNNDEGHPVNLPAGERVISARNDYLIPGNTQGCQTGLRILHHLGYEYVARWDDDLVPRSDCMANLIACMKLTDCVATGGTYPSIDKLGNCHLSDDGKELVVPDGFQQHLQFYAWSGKHRYIKQHHLYSSFLYKVRAVQAVGGFCTNYYLQREETDISLRLNEFAGPLYVTTDAVADHKFGKGGTRSITGEEKDRMLNHDIMLFCLRMKTLGIDPNY